MPNAFPAIPTRPGTTELDRFSHCYQFISTTVTSIDLEKHTRVLSVGLDIVCREISFGFAVFTTLETPVTLT